MNAQPIGRSRGIALGRRIAEARRSAGVTQAALAKRISTERSAISKCESGRRAVGALELARIAQVLNRPVEWFLPVDAESDPADRMKELRRKREAIVAVCSKHGAHSPRVFGSTASGRATVDSDVDFLVDFEEGRSLLDQAELLSELTELLGRDVDLVTPEGLKERIRDRVLSEAVAL